MGPGHPRGTERPSARGLEAPHSRAEGGGQGRAEPPAPPVGRTASTERGARRAPLAAARRGPPVGPSRQPCVSPRARTLDRGRRPHRSPPDRREASPRRIGGGGPRRAGAGRVRGFGLLVGIPRRAARRSRRAARRASPLPCCGAGRRVSACAASGVSARRGYHRAGTGRTDARRARRPGGASVDVSGWGPLPYPPDVSRRRPVRRSNCSTGSSACSMRERTRRS